MMLFVTTTGLAMGAATRPDTPYDDIAKGIAAIDSMRAGADLWAPPVVSAAEASVRDVVAASLTLQAAVSYCGLIREPWRDVTKPLSADGDEKLTEGEAAIRELAKEWNKATELV